MALSIKPEFVITLGAILAFAPQAFGLKDLLTSIPIPAETIPIGYLLLTLGFIWETILFVQNR
jgi:hypothetical protein